jgi:hypothetical protein
LKERSHRRLRAAVVKITFVLLVVAGQIAGGSTPAAANHFYVKISAPTNGATVSGTVTIATTESNSVTSINVFVDGVWVASNPSTQPLPYSAVWNSASVANGSHTVSVTGYNANNGTTTARIGVNVQNQILATATPPPTPSPLPTPTAMPTPVPTATAANWVTIMAPANGATVSATVTIATGESLSVSWINVYVDGVWIASNPPTQPRPYSVVWNSTTVANGLHNISINGYSTSNVVIATTSASVSVQNGLPTPSPTPTLLATPAPTTPTPTSTSIATPGPPTRTPTPTPTAGGGSAGTYYIDSNQSGYNGANTPSSVCATADSGPGTQASPWCTMAKAQSALASVKPGQSFLFHTGSTWNEQLTLPHLNGTPSGRITIGSYGGGAKPIIDGGSTRQYCVLAQDNMAATSLWSYLTIDGFECRNTIYGGIVFNMPSIIWDGGGTPVGQPGIIISNNLIHNTGPGAYAGGSGARDDGGYRRQLVFWTQDNVPSGVQFIGNTVHDVGGHNSIAIEGDTGGPQEINNTAYHCLHGCFDLKCVDNALVDNNVAHDTSDGSECFYTENTCGAGVGSVSCPEGNCGIALEHITYQRNICWGSQNVSFGCEDLTSGSTVFCNYYNNTALTAQSGIYKHCCGTCANGDVRINARNNIFDDNQPISESFGCSNPIVWDYNDDGASRSGCSLAINGTTYSSLAAMQARGWSTHDLWLAYPLFVDPGANNYSPGPGSPVLGAALPGLVGTAKDMGAIEVTP